MIDGSQGRPEFIWHARDLEPSVTVSPRELESRLLNRFPQCRSVASQGSQGHNLIVGPQVHAVGASPRFASSPSFWRTGYRHARGTL